MDESQPHLQAVHENLKVDKCVTAVVAYEANSIEMDLASVALMGRKDAMSLRLLVPTHDSEII